MTDGVLSEEMMTLLVNTFKRNQDGELIIDDTEHSLELAGFESFRTTFYGSHAAKELGLTILPSLATQDVWVSGSELSGLRREVEIVLDHLNQFVEESQCGLDTLQQRAFNILAAIDRAESIGGGVVIW